MYLRRTMTSSVELPEVSKDGLQIQAKENTIRIAGKLRCAAVARTNWRG
jgi:HSP20 family molecular chaperone IbpA